MNFKQKTTRDKDGTNHRYQTQAGQNCDSSPNLIRLKDLKNYNKENKNLANQHHNREQCKSQRFDNSKSSQFTKRMKTSTNQIQTVHFMDKKTGESQQDLHSSQEFFRFRTKPNAQRPEIGFISQQLTFGEAHNRKDIFTSRQFLQEKKMKNQLIDQMIFNSQRGLCKSFNDFSLNDFYCINHRDKKAKYRLMSELTEGEVEMFYCSKCAINLLQQNFKICQIKAEQCQGINNLRVTMISKLQSKLKYLQDEAKLQMNKNSQQRDLQVIHQEIMNANNKFQMMMRVMEKMRNQSIEKLHELYLKKQNESKIRKENLSQIMLELNNTQQEIKQYKTLRKFANMKQNEFQFITTSLNNKITKFSQNLENLKPENAQLALNTYDQNEILVQLGQQIMKRMQKQHTRRERQITFSRRSSIKQENQQAQDQFICDQLKRPFRVLFPSDQMQQGNANESRQRSTMLQSVKQRPTFTQFQ